MQFQQGVNVMMSALPHQILNSVTFGSYNPYMPVRQDYHNTPNPAGLNVEAQADWYTHDYCVKTGAC